MAAAFKLLPCQDSGLSYLRAARPPSSFSCRPAHTALPSSHHRLPALAHAQVDAGADLKQKVPVWMEQNGSVLIVSYGVFTNAVLGRGGKQQQQQQEENEDAQEEEAGEGADGEEGVEAAGTQVGAGRGQGNPRGGGWVHGGPRTSLCRALPSAEVVWTAAVAAAVACADTERSRVIHALCGEAVRLALLT